MKPLMTRYRKLFWMVRIIVYYLKIFGIAPFSIGTPTSIVNSDHARIRAFQFSKFGLAYNLFIMSLTAGVTITLGFKFYLDNLESVYYNHSNFSVNIIGTVFRVISTCVILILWAFRQSSAVRIMNQLLELKIQIFGLKNQLSNKTTIICLTVHIIINAFIWISFWMFRIILFTPSIFNYIFLRIVSYHVVYWFTLEYFMVVGLITQDLKIVNKNLLNLKEFSGYVYCSPFTNASSQAPSLRIQNSQLTTLRSLMSIRAKLIDLAQEIDDFFSFPILCAIASIFVSLVLDSCDIIFFTFISERVHLYSVILWFIIDLYPIISLSGSVTRAKKQAKLTAQIICKLLATPLQREIKAELESFSIQLLNEDFKFTAYGFLALDNTLLHSMLAATTTYFVILMQHQSIKTKNFN